MKKNDVRKYILIPEWAPLYAMRECFGPTHGPLKEPTPTPVDIIGKLLMQTGKEALTIHEVIKEGAGFSAPVRLTRDNYRLPYEEIAGIIKPEPTDKIDVPEMPAVSPVYIDDENEPGVPASEVTTEENTDLEQELVQSTDDDEDGMTPEIVEEVSDPVTLETTEISETDPYAGMSKSQRRKARREEAARKALESAVDMSVDGAPETDKVPE